MKYRADDIELMHQAQKLFGKILDQLMLASLLSQYQLSREATTRRDALIAEGRISRGDPLIGSMAQQTISNVIAGQRPTYGQVNIWLDVIKDWYQSQEMLDKIASVGLPKPQPFTAQLEKNMWRLALFGTKNEIKAAYKKCKNLNLLQGRPIVTSHSTMNLQTSKNRQDVNVPKSSRHIPTTDKLPVIDAEAIRDLRACESVG